MGALAWLDLSPEPSGMLLSVVKIIAQCKGSLICKKLSSINNCHSYTSYTKNFPIEILSTFPFACKFIVLHIQPKGHL